jgi:dGTP triphosphohydrolase
VLAARCAPPPAVFTFIGQDAAMATDFDPQLIIDQVSEKLVEKYPKLKKSEIRKIVAEEVATLETRPVKDYVSVLSERAAKRRIKNL